MGYTAIAAPIAALCFAVIGVVAFKYRHRIEAIPVQLAVKPVPSGPASPLRLSQAVLDASGEMFPVDVWFPANAEHSLSPEQSRFPVVIYAPGWGNSRDDNTLLCAELASHGLAVLALDDISKSPSPNPADRARDTAPFDLSSDAALERSLTAADWRLNRMTSRVSAIIGWLHAQESAKIQGPLRGHLDTSRIAVLGFSFGGSVAAEMTRLDSHVVAAINMDGWLFGISAKLGPEKPVLIFNSDYPELAADSTSNVPVRRLTAKLTIADRELQQRDAGHAGTIALLFRNTDHGDFSDELFTPPLGAYLEQWHRTGAQRLRLRANMNQLILGFLETHLTGATSNPLARIPDLENSGIEILAR